MDFNNNQNAFAVSGAEAKKKKPIGIIAGICAVAIVGGSALLYNFVPVVKNTVRMAVMKPADYLQTVQTENLRSVSADIAEGYNKSYDYYNADSLGADMNISVDLAEPYAVDEELGMNIENVSAGINFAMDSDVISENISVSINDKEVATADAVIDAVGKKFLVNISELTDSYIDMSGSEMNFSGFSSFNYKSYYEKVTPEYLEASLNKYGDIFTQHLSNCEVSLEKNFSGEAAGVNYEYTKVSAKVSEKQFYNMIYSMLEGMKEDTELEEIFNSYTEMYEEIYNVQGYSENEVPTFDSVVEDAFAEIKEEMEGASEEPELDVCIYVDPMGTIRGYSAEGIQDGEKEEVGFLVAKENNTYGFEVFEDEESLIEVNVVETDGSFSGVCNISNENDGTTLSIGLENIKIENQEIGTVSGILSMDLSEIDESLSNFELVLSAEDKTQKMSVSIPDMADVSLDYSLVENPEIPSVPTDTISYEDITDEQGEAWLKGIFDKLGWDYDAFNSNEYYEDDYYEFDEEYDYEDEYEYVDEEEYPMDEQEYEFDFGSYTYDLSNAEIKINGNPVLMPSSSPEIYNSIVMEDGSAYIEDISDTASIAMTEDGSLVVVFSDITERVTENTGIEYIACYSDAGINPPVDVSVNGVKIGSSVKEVAQAFGIDEQELSLAAIANQAYEIYIEDENNYDYCLSIIIEGAVVTGMDIDFSSEF